MVDTGPFGTRNNSGERQGMTQPDWRAADVEAEVARVVASRLFSHSERPGRFLRFLVEHALKGTADQISEYRLGTEIFNRKASFDPASDPIVRVETGRLRRKLQEYYASEGVENAIRIDLPPRSYVPVFHQGSQRVVQLKDTPLSPVLAHRSTKLIVGLTAVVAVLGSAGYLTLSGNRRSASPGLNPTATPETAAVRSIVVLPFTDLSPKGDQAYFCDGLTEELTATLTKIRGLQVVARTSAFHFKGKQVDVREIARQLGVGLVLEGSVRRVDQRVRVAAQLIDASHGYHIWSEGYNREAKDILAIQEEIARAIAATVSSELVVHWRTRRPTSPSAVQAYDLYLKALYSARDWSMQGLTQAVDELRSAIALDPDLAPAHAALAQYYALLGVHAGLAPTEVMPQAKAAALKALALDQSLAHAHASLALVRAVYEWDWQAAEVGFARALELDPSDPNERQMYVKAYLLPLGHMDEALKQMEQARLIDPISPRTETILGMVYYFRKEYDRAIAQFQKPLELDPRFTAAQLGLGSAYEQTARFAEAVAALQEGSAAWRSGAGSSMLGHTYALMGRQPEAYKIIEELANLSKSKYVSPAYIAAIYAGLGDRDRTMEWLERAYQAHSPWLVYLKVNPRFDKVRGDPRFSALLKRIHLD
jgi:serine/threonine-protein kinase